MKLHSETLVNSDYSITYSGDWVVKELADPPSYQLVSSDLNAKAVISSLNFPKGKNVGELSQAYLNLRIGSENDVMKSNGRTASIENSIKKIPIGYQIEYWGVDSENRNFRFWAVVADSKIVNLYVESYKQDSTHVGEILRSFIKGLKL